MTTLGTNPADYLRTHWWIPLLRGIVAIVFGLVLLLIPITAVFTLVILFGAFALVDGVLAIVQALRFAHPDSGRWWLMLLQGLAGIAFGVLTFAYPGITAITLGLFIAAWAVVTGIFEIGAAFRLRRDVPNEIFLIVAGVLSVLLGLILFFFPVGALIGVVYFVAAYVIISGFALVALAFRLRRGGSVTAGPTV
jgi:uncharacterized membrane protein HdeD (DUF308 family)